MYAIARLRGGAVLVIWQGEAHAAEKIGNGAREALLRRVRRQQILDEIEVKVNGPYVLHFVGLAFCLSSILTCRL